MYMLNEKTVDRLLTIAQLLSKRIRDTGMDIDPEIKEFLDSLLDLQSEVRAYQSAAKE